MYTEIKNQAKTIMTELLEVANLKKGDILWLVVLPLK